DDLVAAMRRRSPILTGADGLLVETLVERAIRRAAGPGGPASPAGAGEVSRLRGFEVLRVLGAGGMGVVYLARQERLKRLVALKVLTVASRVSPDRVARFRREAEMLARVRHPNVVQLYEVGEWHAVESAVPAPYLVMEYVEGGSLAERLASG